MACGDLQPRAGLDITRNRDTAKIVCEATGENWFLVCRENQWVGIMPSDCPVSSIVCGFRQCFGGGGVASCVMTLRHDVIGSRDVTGVMATVA